MNSDLLTLCSELERLFNVDELQTLSRDVLGDQLEADDKSAFARALTERCLQSDALVALCDAMAASRDHLDPRVHALRSHGTAADGDLELGDAFGPYLILRRLGKGRLGTVYLARENDTDVRLKVLRRDATYDRVGLQRFLTASRLVGSVDHPGLPGPATAGDINGRYFVAHRYVEGQTLAARIAKTSAMHIEEARGLAQGILEALEALHGKRLVHGSLRHENILVSSTDGADRIVLLDAGTYHLGVPPAPANGRSDRLAVLGSPKTLSPEQIEGRLPDARSDLYSFGAVLFEVLTGRPVFDAQSAAEAFMAHLTREAPAPSIAGPVDWVAGDVDDFVCQLLNKDPADRQPDVASLLNVIETLGSTKVQLVDVIEEEELEARVSELLANPTDTMAEDALVAAIKEGGDPGRVAEALRLAAEMLDPDAGPGQLEAQQRLVSRAARLYVTTLKDPESAEPLYAHLVELDPTNTDAALALERVRRKLGKHEEIIEDLLARCEAEEDPKAKAAMWEQIGRLYQTEVGDQDQALVAFTQAFCEDPTVAEYAGEVERIASKNAESWSDVLEACAEAASGERATVDQHALFLQMARWYDGKLSRADLALPCYAGILATDPGNKGALDGAASVYRKLQQWSELASILLLRADASGTKSSVARDLRAEAAELYETKLGALEPARDLYERVFNEDATNEKAMDGLVRLHESAGDYEKFVTVLESRARALTGEARRSVLFRLGEAAELYMKDVNEAIRRYQQVVAEDPVHAEALKGLDRAFSQTNRFRDLVQNLEMQIEAAATPRQKIQLWERVAAIWDEEFLDHAKAAAAWENVLDLDPEHDDALANLTRHYRVLERWNDVVLVYERHIELLHGDKVRQLEKLLGLGRVLAEGLKVPERAIAVYEKVLAVDPGNGEALEATAKLKVGTGETHGAVQAIETMARNSLAPQERADHYLRAAQVLEARGDMDAAIERYKLALDANPKDRAAALILRSAYVSRGDVNAAAQLLEQEIRLTESEAARAKLQGEMAALCRDRLGNDGRAESWAKLALDVDPTNLDALRVMGDIGFDAGRLVEASRYYEQVCHRTDALAPEDAVRVLAAYAECLVKNNTPKKAVDVAERLIKVAPDDVAVLKRGAELVFEHGEPQRSFELHWELSHRMQHAPDADRAKVLYRLGESARRAGDINAAQKPLEDAAALDPEATAPLRALALVQGAKGNWDLALGTMYRQLESEHGEDRVNLLLEIGDLAAAQLKDPSYAAKSYLAALAEKPNDRKILTKLMQLYSAEKDWDRLVKVVLKLADFVDDEKQKAKYLHTAGRIAWKELGDVKLGSQILARALEVDPEAEGVVKDGVEVHSLAGNAEALKEALKRQVKVASDTGDKDLMLRTLMTLADLYLRHFKRLDQAVAVYEAALEIDPDNIERREFLAELYGSDTSQYLDKAIAAQLDIVQRDPFRPEAHKALRRLHTEAHQPDGAWCACQTLYVLGQADGEEERFYLRMRSEEGISPKNRLTDADFHNFLMDRRAEPLLTALFTVIQPAVMLTRSKPLQQLGYGPELLIDPAHGQVASAQVIPYVADILGMPCPPLFQNPNDLGELSFVHAQHPSIVLGTSVIGVALPLQTVAFMAARHLTYYRQGLYVRQLVPTTIGQKAWLFAAIRLMQPQFPIPPDIQGQAQEASVALDRAIVGPQRDHLARVVSKLMQEGAALDLKKWMVGVDLTADRAGLLLCDDLATAVEVIRASDPSSSSVAAADRVEEIYKYAVSAQYMGARRQLGIGIGS
jgi:tetratricopeptide (TPR) repeat protein